MAKTTSKISWKAYKCKRCGHIQKQQTNHYGETYSMGHYNTCPKCPPFAKYPEYGGSTVWECVEPLPEGMERPPAWKKVKLGDVADIK